MFLFVRPLLLYTFVFSFLCYVGVMLKIHSLVSHSFLFAFGLKGEQLKNLRLGCNWILDKHPDFLFFSHILCNVRG